MVSDIKVVRGAEKLSRRISTIRTKYALPPLINEIGDLLLKRTQQRFKQEVSPEGTPWAALAQATILRRRREGYGPGPKLVRKGSLRDAIHIIRGRADGGIFFNTGAGFRIGITDPEVAEYANVQNRGNGRIPARRFLGLSALDIRAVDSLLRRKAAQLEASI